MYSRSTQQLTSGILLLLEEHFDGKFNQEAFLAETESILEDLVVHAHIYGAEVFPEDIDEPISSRGMQEK